MNEDAKIRLSPLGHLGDVVPQAIFWRPLAYFTSTPREGEDDLDRYTFANYQIGNALTFDLRHYPGHRASTVTMYLPFSMHDLKEIQHATMLVIDGLQLPKLAVAWRRGQAFEYGKLDRPEKDRLREPEARLLVLKIAAGLPGRRATTEQLIENAARLFLPTKIDLIPSRSRPNQPQWHQIIRNVISHRGSSYGPFARGYAERIRGGLSVTNAGIDYLRSRGYLV